MTAVFVSNRDALLAKFFWAHKSYKIDQSTENKAASAMPTCTGGKQA